MKRVHLCGLSLTDQCDYISLVSTEPIQTILTDRLYSRTRSHKKKSSTSQEVNFGLQNNRASSQAHVNRSKL